ncbi:MAG: hypothetical protein RIR62_3065 [Pseudomonadota bacterium]|jgi:flagellar basal-body rod protein FlgB
MFEKLEITRMAQALMSHAGGRLALAAQNVAHADTAGYRARDLPDFADTWRDGMAMAATRPGHFGHDRADSLRPRTLSLPADPNGNSVSLEAEMIRASDARQAHDMAMAVYRSTSAVTRAALGRGGQ